jgi:acyl-coenzyme A thioesterase PaaI-like protein
MEPYWNEVLIRQVIGRAKRMYSHIALPEAERDVTVYRYETTFTTEQKEYVTRKLGWDLDEKYTTDEIISMIAERKQYATDQIEEFMKETAVDCYLNKRDNDLHRPEDNPLVCYNIRDLSGHVASAASDAAAAPVSRFDLSDSVSDLTKTSRFDMGAAQKVVVNYTDVIVEGDKKEYVFVRGKVEHSGKQLAVIKIYLADPVKRQIGLDEYLVATLYIAGLEKEGKIPLLSTSGEIGKKSSGKVKYVLDLSGKSPVIRKN